MQYVTLGDTAVITANTVWLNRRTGAPGYVFKLSTPGWVAKWPNAAGCKPVLNCSGVQIPLHPPCSYYPNSSNIVKYLLSQR